MIRIKPHHFLDIIKLHGAGYDSFVPDLKMGHDFYKIGNMILNDPSIQITLCINGDDICSPCHFFRDGMCQDGKEVYNRNLDLLMLERFELSLNEKYTALELCQKLFLKREQIPFCWLEENKDKLEKRIEYFTIGAKKYILKYGNHYQNNIDFRAGMMSAFAEVVGAGVKKLAFSAATNDPMEFYSDMALALFFADKYQIHCYLEENLLQTILFDDAPKMLYIFYKNESDIQSYLSLKKLSQNTLKEKVEVAKCLGKLLSYDEQSIEEMLKRSF